MEKFTLSHLCAISFAVIAIIFYLFGQQNQFQFNAFLVIINWFCGEKLINMYNRK